MNINIEYKQPEPKPGEKQLTNSELTVNYIEYAMNQKYKEGMSGSQTRMWGRIQRKLDAAIDSPDHEVEFESAEIDLIKEAIKETKYPAQLARYTSVFLDEFDKLTNA